MFAPSLVIQVLLAPGCIDSGGLQMPEWVPADPHFLPRGRNRQAANALEALLVPHAAPPMIEILKPAASPAAPQPQIGAIRSVQPLAGTGAHLITLVGHSAGLPERLIATNGQSRWRTLPGLAATAGSAQLNDVSANLSHSSTTDSNTLTAPASRNSCSLKPPVTTATVCSPAASAALDGQCPAVATASDSAARRRPHARNSETPL